jgi:hypothetical protein
MSGGNPAAPPENPARNTSTLPPPHWSNQHNSNWKREVNTQRNNTYNAENTQPPGDFPGFSAYSKAPRLRQQTPWQYKQSLPVHQEDSLRPKEPPSANPTLGNGRLSQEWQSPQVSSDVSRNLLQLIKIYDKDLRYRGSEDSLDQCLVAFYDFCQVAMVEPNYHHRAFPTMLAGEAKTFYFDYVANQNYDFGTMVQLVRANFETEERARKIQLEWDTMTFGKIRQSNAGKNYSLIESFDQLAKKLRKLQLGLRQEKRTDAELKDKLLQAMFGVPECDLAVYSGAASFHTACEAIRRSL